LNVRNAENVIARKKLSAVMERISVRLQARTTRLNTMSAVNVKGNALVRVNRQQRTGSGK